MNADEIRKLEQVVKRVDPQCRLVRAWELTGGVSARITAIELERSDGGRSKLVVRQHGDVDFAGNPTIAADEYRLLRVLHAAGLPVAEPCFMDQSGEIFSRPYLVISYIDGETDLAPTDVLHTVHELAVALAAIHRIDVTVPDLPPLPRQEEAVSRRLSNRPTKLDESLSEGRIRATLESAWPLSTSNEPVLLHGDFWPGNVLWREGKLVGIVDWEDAAIGDPLADLGNSRLETLWAFGPDAMEEFTNHYRRLMPGLDLANLPYWDLYAALRPASKLSEWGLDADTERTMRDRHAEFVDQAYEKSLT